MTEPPRRPAGQWTPAELGVHPVIGGGPMPAYFRRPHDERLRAALNPAIEDSRLVVIRGDALTGTSRAGYEAVSELLADWTLEYLPTAAELAARLAAGIPARTVLWLGELRHYVDVDGGAAILSRLDGLLEQDGYVVITTIWPGYWDSYAAAAAAGLGAADPAAGAGQLLARLHESYEYRPDAYNPALGGVVDVPDRFTPAELTAAAETGDPVLAAAAAALDPATVDPATVDPATVDPATIDPAAGSLAAAGRRSSPPRWTPAGSATQARCPPRCSGTPPSATWRIHTAPAGPTGGTPPWPGPPTPAGRCSPCHP
jgi:hypothetical protein